MNSASVDWPDAAPTEFFRWWIVDDRSGKRRLTTYKLTRADAAFAGRAYAAYGGIYIAASLGWLTVVEHQRPTLTDIGGATLAICGALLILGFAK